MRRKTIKRQEYLPDWRALAVNIAQKNEGKIKRIRAKNRNLVSDKLTQKPPIGFEGPEIIGYRWLPRPKSHTEGADYYVARVAGNALNGARIYDGDWIMIRTANFAAPGQLVVVELPEGKTVRFYFPLPNGKVVLRSANKAFKDRRYSAKQVKIKGVVVTSGRDWTEGGA